ncbi:MBL fold metallo-hydrolase [Candidatus Roizmanbacteria bacterium]|nr:MBL fold metallo-hydrolase [Candidatus Roizmanbacteria bacterium]
MENTPLSRHSLIITSVIAFIIVVCLWATTLFDSQTTIVFCTVGQGDGIYIRHHGENIMIDAGPDNSILSCLGKYMPFYDRTIHHAILTHPQADHYGGYGEVARRYHIANFYLPPIENSDPGFTSLKNTLTTSRTTIHLPRRNDRIQLSEDAITFLWPSTSYTQENIVFGAIRGDVLGITAHDPNDFSLVSELNIGTFHALFTGDIPSNLLDRIIRDSHQSITLFKVPHHGSKTGLTSSILKLANPTLSVISVGAKNIHGHPSQEVLDMYKALGKQYIRTDQKGNIVVRIDGKGKWTVDN